MDAEGYANNFHYPESEKLWHVMQKPGDVEPRGRDAEGWKLVDVFLSGGAPWGFTLRGGLEHREPLLITKVEEGSKAAAVCLQVGDELVNINEIPLTGFRQEAICLVKGSHRSLSLVVKRNMKMVDIVAQKMPSENDVHVARSFLTKILRSSMRRNEPISRPHSWHSTKFNENQSESAKTQSPPTAVWQPRYDGSSSSTDLSSAWEQTNLRRVSDQFSSLGSMDSLEHVPHPYSAGQLSPAKSNNSMEHLGGGGKRDSAYSSFSTSSGTPDYTLSQSNAASTENMLYKVNQWDTGGKHASVAAGHSNGRAGHGLNEGGKPDDRLAYFQMPGVYEAPPAEDAAGSRQSTSSRGGCGPVWHVPEKKKSASPSPPPPPPARSDSFAATKVHERGLAAVAQPEAASAENNQRRGHNLAPKSDGDGFYSPNVQFASNKQHSLSTSDVRQSQPHHQRHHSDKSTFFAQPWAASAPKPQQVGGYHHSMQELPTNTQNFGQGQRRNPGAEQEGGSGGQSRYYCVTTVQHAPLKPEDRRSVSGAELPTRSEGGRRSLSPQTVGKVKYQHSAHNKDNNGYSKHQVLLETAKPLSDDRGSQRAHQMAEYTGFPPPRQSEQRRSLPAQHREPPPPPPDIRYSHAQPSSRISPRATPILHSLSMDAADRESASDESPEGKQVKRSERFATTLRNEIQMRRAKLQKSKSAAALPGTEEDEDAWQAAQSAAPADGSFTNTYKDHLKEAQARVLKATSFRRRDLEPIPAEGSAAEALPKYPSSALSRIDVLPLPTVTESVMSKSGLSAAAQITRIGGRKRFPAEKKVRSFSEPDKIHHVGVKEDLAAAENTSSSLDRPFKENGKLGVSNYSQSQTGNQGRGTAGAAGDEAQRLPHSPANKPSALEQQRLGTFAEYEAKWNTQKKPAETRASGRYHSADNILDPGPEDRTKSTCLHERSRSSPSADMYGQKIVAPARKSESECSERKPAEPLGSASSSSDTNPPGDDDGGIAEPPESERRPAAPPPPPHMTGTNPDARHRAHPAADRAASQGAPEGARPPDQAGARRKPPVPPPPRCPESLPGSQSEAFAPAPSVPAPTPAFSPAPSAKSDSEPVKGVVDKGQGAVHHLSASTPPPAPSPPSSGLRPSGPTGMEGQRSPSPQFSPQRLSDRPPVSLPDSNRMEHVIENQNPAVKKVPIRIVHSDGVTGKEKCPYLQRSSSSGDDPPATAAAAEAPGGNRLSSLTGAGQDSVFCPFSRQKEAQRNPPAYLSTVGEHEPPPPPPDASRAMEEQKREELARDIMGKDKSLADILDQSRMKTTMDLMEGIFPQGEQLLEEAQQRRKVAVKQAVARPVAEEREKDDSLSAAVTLVTNSTYYSTSAPKAELLIKMKDMQEQQQQQQQQQEEEEEEEEESEDELDIDLSNKKQELIDSLSKKLQVLREARESLQEDVLDNNALGDEVEAQVQRVCKPNELDKFRMFVGDLDKIVSLLLSLSGRLARVENALNSLEEDATQEERRTLVDKRKLLIRQHEDAKELKENLDRRERLVYDILANYLHEDCLTDYEHFVKMKSALIIEQRKLEDKIKLGEEQLKCLMDSLPLEQRLAF